MLSSTVHVCTVRPALSMHVNILYSMSPKILDSIRLFHFSSMGQVSLVFSYNSLIESAFKIYTDSRQFA
jgi:hypothetical protein